MSSGKQRFVDFPFFVVWTDWLFKRNEYLPFASILLLLLIISVRKKSYGKTAKSDFKSIDLIHQISIWCGQSLLLKWHQFPLLHLLPGFYGTLKVCLFLAIWRPCHISSMDLGCLCVFWLCDFWDLSVCLLSSCCKCGISNEWVLIGFDWEQLNRLWFFFLLTAAAQTARGEANGESTLALVPHTSGQGK